jgi:hypothetical protein
MKADIPTLHKPDILILRRQDASFGFVRLCPGAEKRMMREQEVQIENSGPNGWTSG